MKILNSEPADIDTIFELYDLATGLPAKIYKPVLAWL